MRRGCSRPSTALNAVSSIFPVESVITIKTKDEIPTITAINNVIAKTSPYGVIATFGIDDVVSGKSENCVRAFGAI